MADFDRVHSKFIDSWKTFTKAYKGAEIADHGLGEAIWCGVTLPLLNMNVMVKPAQSPEEFERYLEKATSFANKKQLPWLLMIRNHWLSEADRKILADHHFQPAMPITPMVASRLNPSTRNPALDIVRVQGEDLRMAISNINAMAYGMPAPMFAEAVNNEKFWTKDMFGYVAFAGGEPLAAGAALARDNVLYICLMATHTDHQGRGYADAVLRHVAQEAKAATGYSEMMLHSTAAGLPLYSKMGFKALDGLTAYALMDNH